MKNLNTDAISAQELARGRHYYSDGRYLREKQRLAGDKFVKWVLGLIPSWKGAKILDAGGGWGRYTWQLIQNHGVKSENLTLTDLSEGMLKTAGEEASEQGRAVKMSVCNLEALPFESRQFDVVMANQVLYHLRDIPRGISELARVLQPDGQLLAATNSEKITVTIIALHYQALEALKIPFTPESPSPFSMENGGALLAAQFRQVETFYFQDEDLIDDAAEMRATYETIGRYRNLLSRDDISEQAKRELPHVVEKLAQEIIDREGVLHSPIRMGAFVCTNGENND